jgi:hypothetical protein
MLLFVLLAIRQRIDVTLPCRPTAFHGKTPRSDVARHVLLNARRTPHSLRRVIHVSLQQKKIGCEQFGRTPRRNVRGKN